MDFTLNTAGTKKAIIDQYEELLDAYKTAVRQSQADRKRLTELEKKQESFALEVADEATAASVVANVGRLKTQIATALNELVDQMTGQAEKLEEYKKAIAVQERRIKELYDLESGADALAKLTALYEERRREAEAELSGRISEMTNAFETKKAVLEKELEEQRTSLESAIAQQRAKWLEEKDTEKKNRVETDAATKKEREREESEYRYQLTRTRKLEQDAYEEKKKAEEKAMAERKEAFEKEISAREQAVAEREKKMDELERKVSAFPEQLQKEVSAAEKRAQAELTTRFDNHAKLSSTEHAWEKKMLEQQIGHLKELIAAQEKKMAAIEAEAAKAQAQVSDVAKKAIEGASLNRAFHSVNEIALEQARRPEKKKSEE
jgi:hypothetical protein